jgi:hypothetical protein
VRWGQYYNIDPIWALAFFRRESHFAAHPRWVGWIDSTGNTRNIGNIRYVGPPSPEREPQYAAHAGFRSYRSWDDGIHDWFRLLAFDSNYTGKHTVERILPVYAPASENDTSQYTKDVIQWVAEWQAQFTRAREADPALAVEAPCP